MRCLARYLATNSPCDRHFCVKRSVWISILSLVADPGSPPSGGCVLSRRILITCWTPGRTWLPISAPLRPRITATYDSAVLLARMESTHKPLTYIMVEKVLLERLRHRYTHGTTCSRCIQKKIPVTLAVLDLQIFPSQGVQFVDCLCLASSST